MRKTMYSLEILQIILMRVLRTHHPKIHLQIQPIHLQIPVLPVRELTLETLH